MDFIKDIKEMTVEGYFEYKNAFNEIIKKNTSESEIGIGILLSFGSDVNMLTIIACIVKMETKSIQEKKQIIFETWTVENIETAIEYYYNTFFFKELSKMTDMLTEISTRMPKNTMKKKK